MAWRPDRYTMFVKIPYPGEQRQRTLFAAGNETSPGILLSQFIETMAVSSSSGRKNRLDGAGILKSIHILINYAKQRAKNFIIVLARSYCRAVIACLSIAKFDWETSSS